MLPSDDCSLSEVFELNVTLTDVNFSRLNALWSKILRKLVIFDNDFQTSADLEPINMAIEKLLALKNQEISIANFSLFEAYFKVLNLTIDIFVNTNQSSKEVCII